MTATAFGSGAGSGAVSVSVAESVMSCVRLTAGWACRRIGGHDRDQGTDRSMCVTRAAKSSGNSVIAEWMGT